MTFTKADTTHALSASSYLRFARNLGIDQLDEPTLEIFNSDTWVAKCVEHARDTLVQEKAFLLRALGEAGNGIAAIDVPESEAMSQAQNTVAGVAAVVGMFGLVGAPAGNSLGNLPFTLHRASHSEITRMREVGLEKFTPDAKLGFHNDGNIRSTHTELPLHIAIYNILISYRKPGNFSWVPIKAWSDAKTFEQHAGERSEAVISLTPVIYFDDNGQAVRVGADQVTTPMIFCNEAGKTRFFLNGDVPESGNTAESRALFMALKRSIGNAPRINIAQKERRVIFLNNTEGFHAREVLEDPIPGVDLSRMFLRLVDNNAEICAT